MHTFKSFTILAVAGSALAAPFGPGYWNIHGTALRGYATATETATAYTTVTAASFFQQSTAAPVQPTPVITTTTTAAPAPSQSLSFFQSQQQNTYSPPESAAPSASAASPVTSSGGSGYMAIVNEWRSKMGMSQLTESSTLVANAQKTTDDDKGVMTHELNSGSMAQVLAPGDAGSFESVFVGGWLCELPNASGMNGICSSMSAGWDYQGQTGHADILRNPSYSKIGCANSYGLWGCDLA